MRSIILGLGISTDGCIARHDGAVDFLFMPKDYSMEPLMKSIDVAIMGRKTYNKALELGGSFGDSSIASYVVSKTPPPGKRNGVTFVNKTPGTFVRQLRKSRGQNIWLLRGGELDREFLKADLVGELYLGIVPVLLGAGIPLFPPGFPQRDFKLVENKTYSRGLISLKYRRVRKS
jgi:dihydrofolate reductase